MKGEHELEKTCISLEHAWILFIACSVAYYLSVMRFSFVFFFRYLSFLWNFMKHGYLFLWRHVSFTYDNFTNNLFKRAFLLSWMSSLSFKDFDNERKMSWVKIFRESISHFFKMTFLLLPPPLGSNWLENSILTRLPSDTLYYVRIYSLLG